MRRRKETNSQKRFLLISRTDASTLYRLHEVSHRCFVFMQLSLVPQTHTHALTLTFTHTAETCYFWYLKEVKKAEENIYQMNQMNLESLLLPHLPPTLQSV